MIHGGRAVFALMIALLTLLAPVRAQAAGVGPFAFVVPDGFTDLKRGPAPAWGKLPPAANAMITNPEFLEYAIDFTDPDAQFLPNFNAQVKEGSLKITEAA